MDKASHGGKFIGARSSCSRVLERVGETTAGTCERSVNRCYVLIDRLLTAPSFGGSKIRSWWPLPDLSVFREMVCGVDLHSPHEQQTPLC